MFPAALGPRLAQTRLGRSQGWPQTPSWGEGVGAEVHSHPAAGMWGGQGPPCTLSPEATWSPALASMGHVTISKQTHSANRQRLCQKSQTQHRAWGARGQGFGVPGINRNFQQRLAFLFWWNKGSRPALHIFLVDAFGPCVQAGQKCMLPHLQGTPSPGSADTAPGLSVGVSSDRFCLCCVFTMSPLARQILHYFKKEVRSNFKKPKVLLTFLYSLKKH